MMLLYMMIMASLYQLNLFQDQVLSLFLKRFQVLDSVRTSTYVYKNGATTIFAHLNYTLKILNEQYYQY